MFHSSRLNSPPFYETINTTERRENRKETISVKLSIFTWNIVNVHLFLEFIFGIVIHRKWKEFTF